MVITLRSARWLPFGYLGGLARRGEYHEREPKGLRGKETAMETITSTTGVFGWVRWVPSGVSGWVFLRRGGCGFGSCRVAESEGDAFCVFGETVGRFGGSVAHAGVMPGDDLGVPGGPARR